MKYEIGDLFKTSWGNIAQYVGEAMFIYVDKPDYKFWVCKDVLKEFVKVEKTE